LSELPSHAAEKQPRSAADAGPKTKLLRLADLDGRTRAFQAVTKVIAAIESDLGGSEHLSVAEQQIITRAALTGAMLEDMGVRWLSGEPVDPGQFATLSNAERRSLEAVGLKRRPRDVTLDLAAYVASKSAQAAQDSSRSSSATNQTASVDLTGESRKPVASHPESQPTTGAMP
jgi:hypothetical protein